MARRSGLTNKSTISGLVSQAQQRQAEAEGSKRDGRGKPGHAGRKGVDKRGVSKATFNISREAQGLVAEMATEENLSKADIVEAAIRFLYEQRPDLEPFRVIQYSETQPWRSVVKLDFSERGFFSEE